MDDDASLGGDDARYLALCMPRVLARLPYGAKTLPVGEFNFEEDTGSRQAGQPGGDSLYGVTDVPNGSASA